jgi:hypothetical protein
MIADRLREIAAERWNEEHAWEGHDLIGYGGSAWAQWNVARTVRDALGSLLDISNNPQRMQRLAARMHDEAAAWMKAGGGAFVANGLNCQYAIAERMPLQGGAPIDGPFSFWPRATAQGWE